MKFHKTCDHCGHKVSAYTISLNRSLMQAFIVFAEHAITKEKGFKKRDMDLSNSQYTNFHHLAYFGLIMLNSEDQKWYITGLGRAFYSGIRNIPNVVAIMNGEVLPEDHIAWMSHDGSRKFVSINSFFPEGYKKKEEYREEKSY